MEESIPLGGQLRALYELQAGICIGAAWSDLGDVVGGQFLSLELRELRDKSEESVEDDSSFKIQDSGRRKRLAWLFALLGLLPLLVFKYYNFINESITRCLKFQVSSFSFQG